MLFQTFLFLLTAYISERLEILEENQHEYVKVCFSCKKMYNSLNLPIGPIGIFNMLLPSFKCKIKCNITICFSWNIRCWIGRYIWLDKMISLW